MRERLVGRGVEEIVRLGFGGDFRGEGLSMGGLWLCRLWHAGRRGIKAVEPTSFENDFVGAELIYAVTN